jgi:hypothetical protein
MGFWRHVADFLSGDPGAAGHPCVDKPEVYLDRAREWLRKWNDYLSIGNGAGLAACAAAVKEGHIRQPEIALCALIFLIGVISAGLVPATRYGVAIAMYHRAVRPHPGTPTSSRLVDDTRVYSFFTGVLASVSSAAFCVGAGLALHFIATT